MLEPLEFVSGECSSNIKRCAFIVIVPLISNVNLVIPNNNTCITIRDVINSRQIDKSTFSLCQLNRMVGILGYDYQ